MRTLVLLDVDGTVVPIRYRWATLKTTAWPNSADHLGAPDNVAPAHTHFEAT